MKNYARSYPEEFSSTKYPKLYRCWYAMKRRCSPTDREDSKRYYDKGIRVCEEWLWWPTFARFALENGWEIGLEIDRIDNSLGYSPENCRFVDHMVQNQNRDLAAAHRQIKEAKTRRWSKPFQCVDTGEVFETQIEAQRRHNVDRKSLRYALAGKYQQAGGLRWQYLEASP